MNKRNFKHINEISRGVIRDMLYAGCSARQIAREIGVSPSTITREIKRNRHSDIPRIRKANRAVYCARYSNCKHKSDICTNCDSPYTFCNKCRHRQCYSICPNFEVLICEKLKSWPYICSSNCSRRTRCKLPKFSYAPVIAQKRSKNRLVNSRSGISITQDELLDLVSIVKPLLKRGYSPYAIWEVYKNEISIDVRTFYNYMEMGILQIPSILLPRKVRFKKRKNHKSRIVIERTGREYSDFLSLPEELRNNVVEIDSVEGFKKNRQKIFTLHKKRIKLQLSNLVKDGTAECIVDTLDAYEFYLGSTAEFKRIFGIILADRGKEFDLYNLMERSIFDPSIKRCHVYFCDPNRPNQKGSAENNHSLLRRVLKKGQSDFDKLTCVDMATLNSHINSYPRKSLYGLSPLELAQKEIPKEFFEMLGIEQIKPNCITLKPSLLKHIIR